MNQHTRKLSSAAKQASQSSSASDKTDPATRLAETVAEGGMLKRVIDPIPGTGLPRALLESEVHNRAVLAALPDLMFGFSRAGEILYYNAPDVDELYAKPEGFLGQKIDDILPDNVGAEFRHIIQRTLKTGQIQQFEYQLKVPKGIQDFEARMVVSGPDQVLAIVRNITERKQAQATLLESKNRFKLITETSLDCIFVKDKARRYTFVNPALQKLIGLPEEELLGKTPEDIFGPEQGRIVRKFDDRAFSGETVNDTTRLVIGDKERFFHAIQTPLTMQDGEVTSVLEVAREVTEQKQALNRELHDGVCQQLTGLRFLAASLQRDLSETHPAAADRATQIEHVAADALTSVRRITEGIERLSEKPCALVKALQELADRTSNLYDTQCRFTSRKPVLIENPDTATHLFLIAQEGVINALKHAKCGRITISLSERNGTIRLVVKDDGRGISLKRQSMGMGMSIMQSRATLIGASFDVQAGKAGGTVVTCSWKMTTRRTPHVDA